MTVETKTVLDGLEPVNLQHSLPFGKASLEPDKPRCESRFIATAMNPTWGRVSTRVRAPSSARLGEQKGHCLSPHQHREDHSE